MSFETCGFKSLFADHFVLVAKRQPQHAQTMPPSRAWRFKSSQAHQGRVAELAYAVDLKPMSLVGSTPTPLTILLDLAAMWS